MEFGTWAHLALDAATLLGGLVACRLWYKAGWYHGNRAGRAEALALINGYRESLASARAMVEMASAALKERTAQEGQEHAGSTSSEGA